MTLRRSRVLCEVAGKSLGSRNESQALPFTLQVCTISGILKGEILLVGIQDSDPCR